VRTAWSTTIVIYQKPSPVTFILCISTVSPIERPLPSRYVLTSSFLSVLDADVPWQHYGRGFGEFMGSNEAAIDSAQQFQPTNTAS
jgi:hypothetical protein